MANPSPDEGVRATDLHDLITHRAAWRDALVIAKEHAEVSPPDVDDKGYWQHEIDVFDRTFAALSTPVPEEGLPREPASAAEIHRLLFEGIRAMLIEGADPSASAEWASYDFWNAEGKTRNRFYVETKRLAEELTAKIKSSPAINNRIAEYTRKRDLAFDDAERQYWQNMLDGELARNSPTAVPEAVEKEVERLREALGFYAEEWDSDVDAELTAHGWVSTGRAIDMEPSEALRADKGDCARAALARPSPVPAACKPEGETHG